jgi:hypothetical protein
MLIEQLKLLKTIRPDNRNFNHGIIKKYKDSIINYTKHLNLSDKERIYHFINQLDYIPKCEICNKNRKFKNGNIGYFKTCCDYKCNQKKGEFTRIKKLFNSLTFTQKRFIVENKIEISVINLKIIINKEYSYCKVCNKLIMIRNQKTCSYECSGKYKTDIKDTKRKQKQLDKYGFIFVGLSDDDIKNGITNSSQKEEVKQKKIESNLKSFGHINWNSIVEKQKLNFQYKYGKDVTNCMHIKEINDKVQKSKENTLLLRYGVTNCMFIPEVANKMSKNRRILYNSKRFEDDYSGYVYIIKSGKLNCVKIGLTTNNPELRFKYINKNIGDIEIIKIIKCNKIYKLESMLHEKYDKYNIIQDKTIQGYTEWFDCIILEDLLRDIDEYDEYRIC